MNKISNDIDSQLVEAIQNGDPKAAFADLVAHYSERLYWQIRELVLSHEDSHDILQNVFMKAWQNIAWFRGDAKLSTWLYKIALNESLNFLAQHKRREALSIDQIERIATSLSADPYFDGDQVALELQKAILTLPERQRQVFVMKYFEDMKYEQISEILDTTVGSLKASYHHAVKKIEQYFSNR